MSVDESPSATRDLTDLIRGPIDRVHRSRTPLLIGYRRIALERVKQDVQTGTKVDASRAALCIPTVDDAECRSESARGDAGLEAETRHVDDGSSGRLGAGSSGGRDWFGYDQEGRSSMSDCQKGHFRLTYWR